MIDRRFAPGFRISVFDGCVLGVGILAALASSAFDGRIGFVIAFTVGHFFLFCNVVRMSRDLELVWAGVLVLLIGCAVLLEIPSGPIAILMVLGTTLVVVGLELQKPSYHGVFWRTINPRLPIWWAETHPKETAAEPEEIPPP